MKIMYKENDTLKLFCQNCQTETNHKILKEYVKSYEDKENIISEEIDYYIVSCCGCESVSMATVSCCSEDVEFDDKGYDKPIENIQQYPAFKDGYFRLSNVYNILDIIREIYGQTCNSIANKDYILAGIGLRTIIEAICKNEEIKGRDLKTKITNLYKNGDISKQDCDILHGIRFIGNRSTHDIISPSREQIMIAIRIIENLLENKYCLVADIYSNLDLPFRNYQDFYNYTIIKIKNEKLDEEICIDDIWADGKNRYYDERENQYKEYLPKIKNEIENILNERNILYYDIDNKYNKVYKIIYKRRNDKLYIIKQTTTNKT